MDKATEPGSVVGLDPGEVRVGVAVSDPERRVAVPVGVVPSDQMERIADLVRGRRATLVVVGHPLSMSGEAGQSAARAKRFAERLRRALEIPVELQDERLSTARADRALADAGVPSRRRRGRIDADSATVILQAWLDRHRS